MVCFGYGPASITVSVSSIGVCKTSDYTDYDHVSLVGVGLRDGVASL